jgi:hypothetical protein
MTFFNRIKDSLKGRARNSSLKDVQEFVDGFRAMTDQDMGVIVAVATVLRVNMEKEGYLQKDLFGDTPLPDVNTLGRYQMDLNKLTRDFNRKGQPTDAIATLVISYTIRCLNSLELRDEGRELWRQLERGFPLAEQALIDGEKTKGEAFLKDVWTEWQRIPVGLEPAPDTKANPWKKT